MSGSVNDTVLVIDDEPLIRMDLVFRLEAAGYRTEEASNAAEAISALERMVGIGVLFTDIQMPGAMDGVELAHYVRRRWPPTILIISSGNRMPPAAEMPSDADFLAKPIGDFELDSVLRNVRRKLAAA